MALIDYQDIANYTGRDLSADEIAQAFCAAIIDGLTGDLEEILRRPLDGTETYVESLSLEPNQNQIFVQRPPVQSVTSVVVYPGQPGEQTMNPSYYLTYKWGVDITDAEWTIVFSGPGDNWPYPQSGFDPLEGTPVEITYVGGISLPRSLKLILIRACSREYLAMANDVQNVANLHAGRMMDYTFADKNAGGFTAEEIAHIRKTKWRRRIVV